MSRTTASSATTSIVSKTETEYPESASVTFVLAKNRLLTIRYSEPMPFNTFQPAPSGHRHVHGRLSSGRHPEAIVDRTADILERVGADVDSLSRGPSTSRATTRRWSTRTSSSFGPLGRQNDLIGKGPRNLIGFSRILTFLTQTFEGRPGGKEPRSYNKTITATSPRSPTTNFLSNKVTFLLDAILGMINLEQEPDHQDPVGRHHDLPAADRHGQHLGHEFRSHARTRLDLGLSDGAGGDHRLSGHPGHLLQVARLVLAS